MHKYNQGEKGQSASLKYRQSEKGQTTRKNYQKIYDQKKKASSDWKLKSRARRAVRTEIERGRLPHPSTFNCFQCNNRQAKHYHHYLGYEFKHWLNVQPVCPSCHKLIDK